MVLRKKKRVVNDSCNISWVTRSLHWQIIIRYRNKCKGCGRLEYTFYCVLAEKQMKLLFSEINSTHLEIMQSHWSTHIIRFLMYIKLLNSPAFLRQVHFAIATPQKYGLILLSGSENCSAGRTGCSSCVESSFNVLNFTILIFSELFNSLIGYEFNLQSCFNSRNILGICISSYFIWLMISFLSLMFYIDLSSIIYFHIQVSVNFTKHATFQKTAAGLHFLLTLIS